MSLLKIEDIVPEFQEPQTIVFKRGTGSNYGVVRPFFSIDKPFPTREDGTPYWLSGTNHEGIMFPYCYVYPRNDNASGIILYLPLKLARQAVIAGRLPNTAITPYSTGYSRSPSYNLRSNTEVEMPTLDTSGVGLNTWESRTDAKIEATSSTFTLEQFNTLIYSKYREVCDTYSGKVTEENFPETYNLLKEIYYYGLTKFLNAKLYWQPSNQNRLNDDYTIPLYLISQSMVVLFHRPRTYVNDSTYWGSFSDWIWPGASGIPGKVTNTDIHDLQIWILGPKFPKHITFTGGGGYISSRESFANPLVIINPKREELVLPNTYRFGGQTIYQISLEFQESLKIENPEYIRSEEDFLIKGKKEFEISPKVPDAKEPGDAVNLGQLQKMTTSGSTFKSDWKSLFLSFTISAKTPGFYPLSRVFFVTNPFLSDLKRLTVNDILVPIAMTEGTNNPDATKSGNGAAIDWDWVVLVEFRKLKQLMPEFDEQKYIQNGLVANQNRYFKQFYDRFRPNGSYKKQDVLDYCLETFGDCALALAYGRAGFDRTTYFHFMSALCPTNPLTNVYYAGQGGLGALGGSSLIVEACFEIFKVGNPKFNIYDITYSKFVERHSNYAPYAYYEQGNSNTVNWVRVTKENGENDDIVVNKTLPQTLTHFGELRSLKTDKILTRDKLFNELSGDTSKNVVTDVLQVIQSAKIFERAPLSKEPPSRDDHLVNKRYLDSELSKIRGVAELDWTSYTFEFNLFNVTPNHHVLSNVLFVSKKLSSISDLTIKDCLVPICFTSGTPGNQPGKTLLLRENVYFWGYVILVTWQRFKELLPNITATTYFDNAMTLSNNKILNDFWAKFHPSANYKFSDIENWCRENIGDCIAVLASLGWYSQTWGAGQAHAQNHGAWNALIYSNSATSFQLAGSGNISYARYPDATSIQFILRKIGNPDFNIYDVTYSANASTASTHYPTFFRENGTTQLVRAYYRKESDPDTEVQVLSNAVNFSSSENRIHSFIFGDKTIPENTFLLPLKEGFKESGFANKFKENTFYDFNTFEQNITLNKDPIDDNHVINKKFADANYYGLSKMGNSEERWNNVATHFEIEQQLKNPKEVTFKFTVSYSNSAPYNGYCGLSNIQFLNADGTPWYLIAVSLIESAGQNWNKAWISKTMPNTSGWNYLWSNLRFISNPPSSDDLNFLNNFENVLEIKARQSSAASNNWYCGVTALQCAMDRVNGTQRKIGSLLNYRYSGTIEFYFDETQTSKPCFKDIKAIRGVQGGFSLGNSDHDGRSMPGYQYMSHTLKIERIIKPQNDAVVTDMIFERPAWNSADVKNSLFQIPFVPSVAFSSIKYKIPEGAPIDFATGVGIGYDEYNPFTYAPRDLQYPLPLNLVNQNDNGKFYFTMDEYNALDNSKKLNDKLYIIVRT